MKVMRITLLIILILAPSLAVAARLGITDRLEGTYVVTFNAPEGEVKVYLPDDLSGGDTVSAAIFKYPSGANEGIKAQNSGILNSFNIHTDAQSAPVGSGSITINIPRNMSGSSLRVTLRDASNREISYSTVAVKLPSSAENRTDTPGTFDFETPLIGQSGRLAEIKGPFDGQFSTTVLNVGGSPAYLVSESPRKLVFEVPKQLSGASEIYLTEKGTVVKRSFTTLKVVKIGEGNAGEVSGIVPEGHQRTVAQNPVPKQSHTSSVRTKEEVLEVNNTEVIEPEAGEIIKPNADVSSGAVSELIQAQLNLPLEGSAALVESEKINSVVLREIDIKEEAGTESGSDIEIKTSDEEIIEKEIIVSEEMPVPSSQKLGAKGDASYSSKELIERIYQSTRDDWEKPAPDVSGTNKSTVKAPNKVQTHYSAKGKFTVQVASFKDRASAESLARELERKGYKVIITDADVPGKGRWSRVSVGSFDTKAQAREYGNRLKREEPRVKSVYITRIKQ